MKVTFFSNYFNHHQRSLCDAFYERLGEDFTFVETEPMEKFRSEMGWGGGSLPSYVLQSHLSSEARDKAFKLAEESGLVIMGTAPEELIFARLQKNKLTFRYSERPLKEGRVKVLIPRLAKKFYVNHYRNREKNIYLLAASAYCASDYAFLRSYPGKCYKFGYFPEGERLSEEELFSLKEKNNPPVVLWAGRFLKLKRADLFIRAAGLCAAKGLPFSVRFVGGGEEEERLKLLVEKEGLKERTEFLGYLSPEKTREEMEKADIFVMTSNFLEGWGSVIYEALSAGCAVIASHAAGAAPFLVLPGKTGYLFQSGKLMSLTEKLERLLKNPEEVRHLGRGAFEYMKELWNPAVAAQRVLEFAEGLIALEPPRYEEGPLSPCELLKNNWYRE
ncbi:MAG: glycosyltransferase family 4 protein [Lachnospiraceae bacterium]|nr:glycosyltransferase family 4 protein [Lachnospiraceae bacterium]